MAFLPDFFRPKLGAEESDAGGGNRGPGAAASQKSDAAVPPEAIAQEPSSAAEEGSGRLVLLLDDVLSRVPTRALKPGLHDPSRELHFDLEELILGITRGRPTIPRIRSRSISTPKLSADEAWLVWTRLF